MTAIKRILNAIRFLTILPLPDKGHIEPIDLGKSMAYFPLVGIFIGLVLVCTNLILIKLVSPLLAAVLLVTLWAYFTGALHFEGFVDAVDGFSASQDKEKILNVMKDHHCGAKGVIALVFLIILKIALLGDIPDSMRLYSLILVPAIGRWVMVCAAFLCPYARETQGLGKAFVENVGTGEVVIASVILIAAGISLLWIKFIVLMIPVLIFAVLSFVYVKKKINGITGDVLGAMNELAEVLSLGSFLLLR
ncbi:MAG: adenosylcobinamide-GDP ribazoletransferase [Smithellaceae bacterium]